MNDGFLDLVRKRQSVRVYKPMPIPREIIDRCLEAARLAPSACNSQPWSFLVADAEPLRSKLAAAAFAGVYNMNAFAASAPVLIAAITERSKAVAALAGRMRGVQYNLIDLGIACEHLVLQAAAAGLGACWLGWFDEKAVKRALNLSRWTHVDILISLGYPVDPTIRDKQRKPLTEIRRYLGSSDKAV